MEDKFIENKNGIIKKVFLVIIWIFISLGAYQCSSNLEYTNDAHVQKLNKDEKKDENKQTDEVKVIPEFDKNIRVLIMTQGHKGIYHTELTISGQSGMIAWIGDKKIEYKANETLKLDKDKFENHENIIIKSKDEGRLGIGDISYRGIFECYNTPDGIVLVNELTVEEYLYGVLPSEMPSSYPLEALKAQAISARSYTYYHKRDYAYPQWRAHMDNSTSFQVYMNCGETKEACTAVDETRNQVLTYNDELVESFYYSTSGGFNGGAGVWNDIVSKEEGYLIETGKDIFEENSKESEEKYKNYIDNKNTDDIEYNEAWYRWNYDKVFDADATGKLLLRIYELSISQPQNIKIRSQYLSSDKITEESAIKDIRILKRRKSGLITDIMIETKNFKVSVKTQHTIRQVLGCSGDTIIKNDNSSYTMGEILPSAYFYIEKIYDKTALNENNISRIIIHGAGFGHGCGMSQNGAKCLAERGLTVANILAYYYNGDIKDISSYEDDK